MSRRVEKSNNKIAYIIFAALFILLLLAGGYLYYVSTLNGNIKKVTLKQDGVENASMHVDDLYLGFPGSSSEYTIEVECAEAGTYAFTFRFTTEDESNVLAPYVFVDIISDGETKTSATLSDLFAGGVLVTKANYENGVASAITVRYTLSEEANDDVQGAGLDFYLYLTVNATNE